MEKLDYLIKYLLSERKEKIGIPEREEDKVNLYKTLVNIREAKKIDEEYLKVEDEFLKEELELRGVVNIDDIKIIDNNISLYKGDITSLKVDVIVNPANSEGLGCFNPAHKCLDNIIGVRSGVRLRYECNEVMKKKNYHLDNGEVFITNGYNLPSRYIIHTVGPINNGNISKKEEDELYNCYYNSLECCMKNNLKTIAFPCISTGLFSFPNDIAATIAIKAVKDYIKNNNYKFDRIIFCTFLDKDYQIYKEKLGDTND